MVQRQAVTVLTQGTLTDPCMLSDSPHATFAATVVEEPVEGASGKTVVGICMVDTAASTLLLGQFEDSKMRSQTLKYFTGKLLLVPESRGEGVFVQRGGRCRTAPPQNVSECACHRAWLASLLRHSRTPTSSLWEAVQHLKLA